MFFIYYYYCFAYSKWKKKGETALHHRMLFIRTKIPLLRAQTPNHYTTFPKITYKGDLEVGDHFHSLPKENDLVFLETWEK